MCEYLVFILVGTCMSSRVPLIVVHVEKSMGIGINNLNYLFLMFISIS
jgi:hypothetical protein